VSVQYELPFSVKSLESRFLPVGICAEDGVFGGSSCEAGGGP
jgi:hypothetical protein